MVAQQAALPAPVVQEFRSFPAPSGRPQVQRQQRQLQQVQQKKPQQVQQQKPVQQQKKRARNAFADLDEDSE
jgi:chaperonin cofactor prefoldin